MRGPFYIDPDDDDSGFPDVRLSLRRPNGLLAVGGNLSDRRLMDAYRAGVFPWYTETEPILWWSPDPRGVLVPDLLHVSRSLRKVLRRRPFEVRADTAFRRTMELCGSLRRDAEGTWITAEMLDAYTGLHRQGLAHSVEAWADGELQGGLYGVCVGRVFCGESMFSLRPDASKVALVHLALQLRRWEVPLIDTQLPSPHLSSMGGRAMSRARFVAILAQLRDLPAPPGPWTLDRDLLDDLSASPD